MMEILLIHRLFCIMLGDSGPYLILFKLGFSDTTPSGEGGVLCYCWVWVGVLAPHETSTDTTELLGHGGGADFPLGLLWHHPSECLLTAEWGGSPGSLLCLLWHYSGEVLGFHITAFAGVDVSGVTDFSFFSFLFLSAVCLVGVDRGFCKSFSVLLGCPFPAPLTRVRRLFGELFISAPVRISGVLASSTLNVRYMR